MRKTLLASAAILGTASGAWAQMEATGVFQSQGMMAMPWAGGPAPNNNNNALGTAAPGAVKVPTPGTVVIRLNGRVYADVDASWSTLSQSPPGSIGTGVQGFKLNPVGIASYMRLYPGMDGMATNGLRYGATIELRMNVMGGSTFGSTGTTAGNINGSQVQTAGAASSGSGNSSAETVYVRRAFTYIGSDQMGIVRLGMGDDLASLFDYTGIFTAGSWDGGIGNILDAQVQSVTPNAYLSDWPFMSGNGVAYDPNKIVYLSPQFFGFDFGLEYDPSMGNSFSDSITSSPYQTGACASASANCITLSSGNDPSRWINKVAAGARYMGSFGGLDVKAYALYVTSGRESTPASSLPANVKGAPFRYADLGIWNGGIALTYAGITVNADAASGWENGTMGLTPKGGVPTEAWLAAISYANGPISFGVIGEVIDNQGSANLVHVSQRHAQAIAVGGAYKIAPGITLAAEWQYEAKHQGGFNFVANSATFQPARYNDIKVQGITFATIVSW